MTEIVAHRGSRINRPENTLAAFEEAIRVGADGIELDVHLSRDGEIIVIHDETVERTTNGAGLVKDMTVAELKQLDAGIWFDTEYVGQTIPTLREVFELLTEYQYKGVLNIELKTSVYPYKGIEKKIGALLAEADWSFEVMYSSFSLRSLLKMHRIDPEAELGYLVKNQSLLTFLGGFLPWIGALHLPHKWYFKKGKNFKKHLRLWTVNDEKVMKKAFQQGVTAIITDKPEIAIALRKEMM